jgi:hypothetical protein
MHTPMDLRGNIPSFESMLCREGNGIIIFPNHIFSNHISPNNY